MNLRFTWMTFLVAAMTIGALAWWFGQSDPVEVAPGDSRAGQLEGVDASAGVDDAVPGTRSAIDEAPGDRPRNLLFLDATTSDPIVGLEVTGLGDGQDTAAQGSVRTDHRGRATITNPLLTYRHPNHGSGRIDLARRGSAGGDSIHIPRAGVLQLDIRSSVGAGTIELKLMRALGQGDDRVQVETSRRVSFGDVHTTVAIDGVAYGAWAASVRHGVHAVVPAGFGFREDTGPVNVAIGPAAEQTIRGTVVDDTGAPVVGAQVQLDGLSRPGNVVTSQSGAFELIRPGGWRTWVTLSVLAPDHRHHDVERFGPVAWGQSVGTIVLTTRKNRYVGLSVGNALVADIMGTIRVKGRPPGAGLGASVRVTDVPLVNAGPWLVLPPEAGLDDVMRIRFGDDVFWCTWSECRVHSSNQDEQYRVLDRGSRQQVTCSVIDGAGLPLAGATVQLVDSWHGPQAVRNLKDGGLDYDPTVVRFGAPNGRVLVTARSGADGRCVFEVDRGGLWLRASTEDHSTELQRIGERERTITLRLARLAAVRGRVVDRDGKLREDLSGHLTMIPDGLWPARDDWVTCAVKRGEFRCAARHGQHSGLLNVTATADLVESTVKTCVLEASIDGEDLVLVLDSRLRRRIAIAGEGESKLRPGDRLVIRQAVDSGHSAAIATLEVGSNEANHGAMIELADGVYHVGKQVRGGVVEELRTAWAEQPLRVAGRDLTWYARFRTNGMRVVVRSKESGEGIRRRWFHLPNGAMVGSDDEGVVIVEEVPSGPFWLVLMEQSRGTLIHGARLGPVEPGETATIML